MKKIGVLSDTHCFIPKQVFTFFKDCDELWHAGDIGNLETYNTLRYQIPQNQLFNCEGAKVLMTHIGGYPGHYERVVLPLLDKEKPNIFVAGHSHILRIMYDEKRNLLHINPGACGHLGFHQKATLVRFDIDNGKPKNLEYQEFEK